MPLVVPVPVSVVASVVDEPVSASVVLVAEPVSVSLVVGVWSVVATEVALSVASVVEADVSPPSIVSVASSVLGQPKGGSTQKNKEVVSVSRFMSPSLERAVDGDARGLVRLQRPGFSRGPEILLRWGEIG
jgi:hypothetical protein